MERSDVITTLEVLKANCPKYLRDYHALNYAIASLKTDETYQLMYEGEDVYTKDEVIAMFKELQLEIEELNDSKCFNNGTIMVYTGIRNFKKNMNDLIQQKINALKAESEG